VLRVRDWYENKKEGQVLMKVTVQNKTTDLVKYRVTLKSSDPVSNECNVYLPESYLTDTLYMNESKCIGHF